MSNKWQFQNLERSFIQGFVLILHCVLKISFLWVQRTKLVWRLSIGIMLFLLLMLSHFIYKIVNFIYRKAIMYIFFSHISLIWEKYGAFEALLYFCLQYINSQDFCVFLLYTKRNSASERIWNKVITWRNSAWTTMK